MRRSIITSLLVVSAGWIGCSSERPSFRSDTSDFGARDAGGLENVDAGCSGVVCSRDLRSVRDCSDKVVKECAADKACGNGQCVDPCDAAAINEGSVGCSFAIPGPNGSLFSAGSCAAFLVANNWTSPATIRLEFDGKEMPLDGAVWVPVVEDGVLKHKKLDGPIPPGSGAVVFLSNPNTGAQYWTGCPRGVKPVFGTEKAIYGTGLSKATLARTSVPVSMYSIFPYGGADSFVPSGTLLLPTTSFRKNYILMSSWGSDTFGTGVLPGSIKGASNENPTVQIVAVEDDTSVDVLPKVAIVGGNGIPSTPPNRVMNVKLQRGEVLQIIQRQELVGSVLESSKPVGVFGGHTGLLVPSDIRYADVDNEQIPPLSAWGHEYAVLPAPDRAKLAGTRTQSSRDPSVVRMVGAANGTKLVYEPAKPTNAPDALEQGQLARFFAQEPFVVRSQDSVHPFFVAVMMVGSGTTGSLLGDPETATVVPSNQWLDSYGFFSDFTYARSAIFVTRRRTNGAFHDITLDCAGALKDWTPITADYEWTYVELTRSQKPQTYAGGTCTDGWHGIRSEGPFSLSVWGLGTCASYSYPGGMGLRRSTELQVPVR